MVGFFGITAFHRFLSLIKDLSLFLQTQEKIAADKFFLKARISEAGKFWDFLALRDRKSPLEI